MMSRGMKKWQPFDSVTSTRMLVREIIQQKSKQEKIELSTDQIAELSSKLTEAFYDKSILSITYFQDGNYLTKNSIITKIDHVYQRVYFADHSVLYFKQIVRIQK